MKAKAHKKITQAAIKIFTQQRQSDFTQMLHKYGDEIADGSVEADIFPIFERATNWHFYRANDTLKITEIAGIKVYPTSDHILKKRISQLAICVTQIEDESNKHVIHERFEDAFELVGRALHHIQDMSTPSHVSAIYHGPDFPFNQVDGALIIPDHFESFSAQNHVLSSILENVHVSNKELAQLQKEASASFLDTYNSAAKNTLQFLFDDANTSFIEGTIDGQTANIPLSMFWQQFHQHDAKGKIKGFGSFGPLAKCFDNPEQSIVVDGQTYQVTSNALIALCSILINKMIRDSLRALFVAEKTMLKVQQKEDSLHIESLNPVYGENYKKGYIGFTYQKTSIVSIGIAYITRWARLSHVKVSHAFVVTNENQCIEAVGEGVRIIDLNHYFNDPHCQVFFRKPQPYNDDVANRISQAAHEHIGKAYDHSLIPAHFFLGSWFGRVLNRITFGALTFIIMKVANSKDQWICSELAAYCLDQQPEYHDQGILLAHNETIDPQELFEDNQIFVPWKNTNP